MKKKVITFMLIVLVVVPVYSQKWVWLYPYPTPNYIRDFCFVNATTGFLATENKELWRTVDGGVTWSATVFEEDLKSIFFLNETYGWMMCLKTSGYSTYPYILRTVDGGTTWSSHTLSGSYYDYDSHTLFFLSDKIGWIACEAGKIKKTLDGGQTWIDKPIGNSSYDLFYIYFTDQNNGVVIGRGSNAFCFARTSDGGNQWEKRFSGLSNSLYGAAFISPNQYYVTGNYGIILRTSDYGKMWSFPSETGFANLRGLAFTSQSNGWAVGDGGKLLKTTDGGDSWQELILGIASEYKKISFLNTTTGWILGNQSSSSTLSQQVMLNTQDGGQNWNNFFRSYEDNLTFTDVAFTTRTSGWLISNNSIYATNDNGRTWGAPKRSSTSEVYYAISAVDSATVYVVGKKSSQGLILKTTSSGASWIPQTIGTSSSFSGVCFLNEMNGWVVGNGGTILHTTNGGNTWEIQSSNVTNNLYDAFFLDQNHGWVTGYNHTVLRTTDGGNNWILTAFSDNVSIYSIYFLDTKIGWLGTDGGLYKTVDGGDKWNKVTLPSSFYDNIDALYFTSENLGWIMANSGGWSSSYSQIYSTTDGGITWETELSTSQRLYDFCFVRWDHDWADAWSVGANSMIAYANKLFTRIQISNEKTIPTNFELYQNYPNPFNSKTVIEYDLPQMAKVKLTVFDVLGREVKTIVEEQQHPGRHRVELDTKNWGSGTFFYRIQANEFTKIKKLIHLK